MDGAKSAAEKTGEVRAFRVGLTAGHMARTIRVYTLHYSSNRLHGRRRTRYPVCALLSSSVGTIGYLTDPRHR